MRFRCNRKTKFGNWSFANIWLLAIFFISLCLICPQAGLAAWSSDPITVSADEDSECRSQVVYDGSGGYYVVWQNTDIYSVLAQHYSADGDATWAAPIQVSAPGDYPQQESTADGSGGLLVSWTDEDDFIRVQRILLNGTVAWAEDGVVAISASEPWIAADGTGGAIVMSYGGGLVNRVDANGTLPWGDADNAIRYSDSYSATKIVPDGTGGAILVWNESDAFTGVAVQRVNSDGEFLWNSGNPLQLNEEGESTSCPRLVPQEDGGAIVTWYDSSDYEVMAQKINGSGAIQWTAGGVVVATGDYPEQPELASDMDGGAFITWEDEDTIYAQHIDTAGAVAWTTPVDLTGATDLDYLSYHPRHTVEDGLGGFITTWSNTNYEVRAQLCNAAGEVQWTATGALVAEADSVDYAPKLTSNGQGGAVIVWVDYTVANSSSDIFMQGISALGVAGNPGYTPLAPPPDDDDDDDITPDQLDSDDDDDGGLCFVATAGTSAPWAGLLLSLIAGIAGLVAVRRR